MDRYKAFLLCSRRSLLVLVLGLHFAFYAQVSLAKENIVTSQIHNAPGWLPAHTYTYSSGPPIGHKTRVVNGGGWNGSVFLPYRPLNAYELTSAGTCTSGSSGGPSDTGSSILDGTCTWKYLSKVDYITLTGWLNDSGTKWVTGTRYAFFDVVMTETKLSTYELMSPGCTSTAEPSGKSDTGIMTDGCQWQYIGDVIYTSGANHIPNETFQSWPVTGCIGATPDCTSPGNTLYITSIAGALPNLSTGQIQVNGIAVSPVRIAGQTSGKSGSTGSYTLEGRAQRVASEQLVATQVDRAFFHLANIYQAELWNDREYVAGSNGETNPILMQNHNSQHNDSVAPDYTGGGNPIFITAAAGEDFGTTLGANPTVPLGGYDANNGVGIRNTNGRPAICMQDNSVWMQKLQFKSSGDAALDGMGFACGSTWRSCNNCRVERSIAEADGEGTYSVLQFGADTVISNSLILTRGKVGITFDYPGYLWDSTIINIGSQKNTVGVQSSYNWVFTCGVTYTGNAIYGFTTAFAAMKPTVPNTCANTLDQLTVNGGGNVTDAQSGTSPDGTWFGGPPTHAYTHPGTTYNVPAPSAFVAYPGNYRISQSSALYGAGRAIGDVDLCISFAGWRNPGSTESPSCHLHPDATDIVGHTRPQSGRYDVGAIEFTQ